MSSSFSFDLKCEPILAVFFDCRGSRIMYLASFLGFHPISSTDASFWMPFSSSTCCNYYLVARLSLFTLVTWTGVKDLFFDSFRTCRVHYHDVAWSDLISPTLSPRIWNHIFWYLTKVTMPSFTKQGRPRIPL